MAIFESETPSSRRLTRRDHNELRSLYGDSALVHHGTSVKAPRLVKQRYRPEQDNPQTQFLYSDSGTKDFLLRKFPLLQTDEDQKFYAGRWNAVIHYYFRMGWTDSRVEKELGWNKGEVGSIVQNIRRWIKGLRPNGKAYSTRKRGRPRKVVAMPIPDTTPVEMPVKQAA